MNKKELKQKFLEIEAKHWKSESMLKFFEKNFFSAVELKDGSIIEFSKPSINTHFCYSFDEFRPDTIDFAHQCCDSVRKNFDVFLSKNLRDINRKIDLLRTKIEEENKHWEKIYIFERYYRKEGEGKSLLKDWTNSNEEDIKFRFRDNNYRLADLDEIKAIFTAYIELKEYMTKRCKTYWKRFGGSKLHTWTYSMWD